MRLYPRIGSAIFGALALTIGAGAALAAATVDVETALAERFVGEAEAPVTIVEHFSMTCPHCADFHANVFPALKEKYIDTGKVKFVFSDFPLDRVALQAAVLARCAEPARYPGLVEVLLGSQQKWATVPDPVAALETIGRLAGIGPDRFQACMDSEALVNGLLARRQEASQAGVSSTPSFFVNGQLHAGGMSVEEFSRIIDPLLADD